MIYINYQDILTCKHNIGGFVVTYKYASVLHQIL